MFVLSLHRFCRSVPFQCLDPSIGSPCKMFSDEIGSGNVRYCERCQKPQAEEVVEEERGGEVEGEELLRSSIRLQKNLQRSQKEQSTRCEAFSTVCRTHRARQDGQWQDSNHSGAMHFGRLLMSGLEECSFDKQETFCNC